MDIDTEQILDEILTLDPKSDKETNAFETKHNCKVSVDIEKIHQLQHVLYYDLDFGNDNHFYIEMESGINAGDKINNANWDYNTCSNTKEVEVLKDVVFSESGFDLWFGGRAGNKERAKRLAIEIFNNAKPELLDMHRKQSYDDYVTGGGTNATDRYYKERRNELQNRGVFWEYIYELAEVDRNFI